MSETETIRRATDYPLEPSVPHRRCWSCGRFLRWDDYFGRYLEHVTWDPYMGAWELDCS